MNINGNNFGIKITSLPTRNFILTMNTYTQRYGTKQQVW